MATKNKPRISWASHTIIKPTRTTYPLVLLLVVVLPLPWGFGWRNITTIGIGERDFSECWNRVITESVIGLVQNTGEKKHWNLLLLRWNKKGAGIGCERMRHHFPSLEGISILWLTRQEQRYETAFAYRKLSAGYLCLSPFIFQSFFFYLSICCGWFAAFLLNLSFF